MEKIIKKYKEYLISQNYSKHTLRAYLGDVEQFFEFIKKFFPDENVSIEEIKELNPELRWGELQYDEYIKIPRPLDALAEAIDIPPDTMYTDTLVTNTDTLGVPFWSEVKRRHVRPEPIRDTIRIAISEWPPRAMKLS